MDVFEGTMTYKYVIAKHIDACAEASEKLLQEDVDPAKWVHGWGVMIAVLERLSKPYLEGKTEKIDHAKWLSSKSESAMAEYLVMLLDRYETVVSTLHKSGVIHPRDIPVEDARSWFLEKIGVTGDELEELERLQKIQKATV